MNKLSQEKRAKVVAALVEGCSLRSTCRMTGVSMPTVLKLLTDLGEACERYQDENVRGLTSKRVQADEIWSFVGCKAKNIPAERKGELGIGDAWTWTAICADTKLCISWAVGDRSAVTGRAFMEDVASRLSNRIQLTTDGHKVYLDAVERAFGSEIDYAVLQKHYGVSPEAETRYSPATCIGVSKEVVCGLPLAERVSTSFVERQNLTMRMGMRRFTRLTNGFSKKLENHKAVVALYFMHYNFARVHKTLRVTPAMEAGLSDHVWTLEEIIGLLS